MAVTTVLEHASLGSRPGADPTQNMYGTTRRTWDPALAAWRIAWSNPARNHYEHQIGRRSGKDGKDVKDGKDIVQLGHRANGVATRWMFTEIAPRSFRWLGDVLAPDGTTCGAIG